MESCLRWGGSNGPPRFLLHYARQENTPNPCQGQVPGRGAANGAVTAVKKDVNNQVDGERATLFAAERFFQNTRNIRLSASLGSSKRPDSAGTFGYSTGCM